MKISDETMSRMIENSFKNFHVKGFDYLCLVRSPEFTRKIYFFDGDITKLPEVVNPHDHRYDFRTVVLKGAMSNSTYVRDDVKGVKHQLFEWRTPLNGGDGFTWRKEVGLQEITRFLYGDRGTPSEYFMKASEFHTIRMHSDQVLLCLDQYEDVVPVDKPTLTFMQDKKAPSLDGLYEKFTADEIISRLKLLNDFQLPLSPHYKGL